MDKDLAAQVADVAHRDVGCVVRTHSLLVGAVAEEAARAGINASAPRGPAEIEPELRAAALQRAMAFDSRGTVHA